MSINIRPTTNADAENCGRVIYKAFCGIADQHNFPHDFSGAEQANGFAQMLINNPKIYGIAAESDGRFVGSNFLWEHSEIAGVGPITVDTDAQASGVGRDLMEKVIERGQAAKGIRLVQDAFNRVSLSLYTALGFDVVEPLVIMTGDVSGDLPANCEARPLEEKDLAACDELCKKVHGFSRVEELKEISQMIPSIVVVRENRVAGYAAAPLSWQMNHAVAETKEDMQNLLIGAAKLLEQPLSFLLPIRNGELFRWCLSKKMRIIKPMNLMARGAYREPRGCFLPSVLY